MTKYTTERMKEKMQDLIRGSYGYNNLIFDENKMEVKVVAKSEDIDKLLNPIYREYAYHSEKLPKSISYIMIEEMTEEKIVLRNKNIKLKTTKKGYCENWLKEDYKYNQKDDRILTVDLKDRTMSIVYGGRIANTKKINFKNENEGYFWNIYNFINKNFMKFKTTCVIPEQEDFFKQFREMYEENVQYKYLLNLEADKLGIDESIMLQYGMKLNTTYLSYKSYISYSDTSINQFFSSQLAGALFLINNPGLESLYNSSYANELYRQAFSERKIFPEVKLNDVLGVKKTTLKMMNLIVDKIAENVTLISSATCDKNKIQEIISNRLFSEKETIDKAIDVVKGYNNLEYFIKKWLENNFYNNYFLGLKKNYHHVRWYGIEKGGEKQFNETIDDCCYNLLYSIKEMMHLLKIAPSYCNNTIAFSDYFTAISRKQGLQIQKGLRLMIDYITMQEQMKAKWEKYPYSIHVVHDIAAANYNIYKDVDMFKQHCGGFASAVAKYVDLDYFPRNEEFVVIHPQSVQEMFVEGCSLNHCVASYVPEVASGRSKILFIRKKDDEKTPYFTVEVQKKEIMQIKGLNQCDPSDEKLIKFIKTWAETKNLTLNS